jgi:hypothetical protein
LVDVDFAAEALKHDLGFLMIGPFAFFHKNWLLSQELNSTPFA